LLDGLLQRLEHGLRQPGLLRVFVEHVRAEEVLQGRVAEVDLVQIVLGGGDRLDRGLARVRHRRRLLGVRASGWGVRVPNQGARSVWAGRGEVRKVIRLREKWARNKTCDGSRSSIKKAAWARPRRR